MVRRCAAAPDRFGYSVILTPVDYLYFDQAQEVDPAERGLSWGTRASDTHKVFTYISGNIAANIQLSPDCSNDACQGLAQAMPVTKPENVMGLEAALWGETIRTDEQLEYMAFPRLLSLAERAWHRASWEPMDGMNVAAVIDTAGLTRDWERFANTLGYKELPRLDQDGIAYRVEVPGARIKDGVLEVNGALPGLILQYKDSSGQFVTYDPEAPPSISATEVRAVTASGRVGRAVPVP